MVDLPDLVWKIGALLIVAGAVYGGIRADLRGLHLRMEQLHRSTRRAHRRLDKHINKGLGDERKK